LAAFLLGVREALVWDECGESWGDDEALFFATMERTCGYNPSIYCVQPDQLLLVRPVGSRTGERACSGEAVKLVASAAVDLATIVPLARGAAIIGRGLARVGAGLLARAAAGTFEAFGYQVAGAAFQRGALRSVAANGSAYAIAGLEEASVGAQSATTKYGPLTGLKASLSLRDFIPGLSTVAAWKAYRACRLGR
jgi:hypothetical protein